MFLGLWRLEEEGTQPIWKSGKLRAVQDTTFHVRKEDQRKQIQ